MNDRKPLLAKIHIAKKDLGLDEDSYRALIARHGGQGDRPSAANLQISQLESVLRELTGKGWRPRPKGGRTPRPAPSREALIGKIKAQLTAKAQHQGRAVPWSYADAIARRVAGVERVEWCDETQLRRVVAALAYDARRSQANEQANEVIK